ncbi:hypothetical protein JCM10908_001381 [Rhodotorula pacifica]|uniref:uncharacterized protein n=1 Tax=Rhodotorula pacifica TaxID=1495444 RepID=UPI0031808DCF
MQGQANHFFRYAPEKIEFGMKRYQAKTKRLYGACEEQLTGKKDGQEEDWLVGGKYSLADMRVGFGVETLPYSVRQPRARRL